ncbi:MAG: hypothetical protein ABSA26_00555 [Thermoguttaceae bacterium]
MKRKPYVAYACMLAALIALIGGTSWKPKSGRRTANQVQPGGRA